MLMPSILGESLFDDFLNDFSFMNPIDERRMENKLYGPNASRLMKTDIREKDQEFEILMDLPGFEKEDIKAELEKGYLTISASKAYENEEKNKETGTFIRKERYSGSCQRSFYVGDHLTQADIKAEFKSGVLKLSIPKKEVLPEVQNKYIAIEG